MKKANGMKEKNNKNYSNYSTSLPMHLLLQVLLLLLNIQIS